MLKLGCLEIQGEMSVKGSLEHRVNGMQLAPEDVFDLPQISTFCNQPTVIISLICHRKPKGEIVPGNQQ